MPIDLMEVVSVQTQFYRNNFRRLVKFVLALIAVAFLLLGFIFYQYFSKPPVKYFVTTSDGRLIELTSVEPP